MALIQWPSSSCSGLSLPPIDGFGHHPPSVLSSVTVCCLGRCPFLSDAASPRQSSRFFNQPHGSTHDPEQLLMEEEDACTAPDLGSTTFITIVQPPFRFFSFLLFLLAFRFLAFQVYKSKGHRISFFYEYTRLLDLFDWNWERYKKPNASLYIGAGLLEGLRHHGFWWFGKTWPTGRSIVRDHARLPA